MLATLAVFALAAHSFADAPTSTTKRSAVGPSKPSASLAKAVFAGGCFWCVEAAFEGLPGVKRVVSGFTGGPEPDPAYDQVSSGRTGHAEAVEIIFDPAEISYEKLLTVFWHNIDPTQANAQFCDHGPQYRSAIFPVGAAQQRAALQSKRRIEVSKVLKGAIVTQIVPFTRFWPAEEYHQDYYRKNPVHYQAYRLGCGRDRRLREIWGASAGGH
jgi:peptide-methionine (S)-S-oxide reductase